MCSGGGVVEGWVGGGGSGGGTLSQLTNFTPGPNATLNTEIHKNPARIMTAIQSMHHSEMIKIK